MILLEIDAIDKASLAVTPIKLCTQQRYFEHSRPDDYSFEHWPILKSYNLGSAFKEHVIENINGTVTLDISPSSLGYQKRFLDLLDNLEVINRNVRLIEIKETATGIEKKDIFRGKVDKVDSNPEQGVCNLRINSKLYTDDVLNYSLTRARFGDMKGNAGRLPAPVVFGSGNLVKPTYFKREAYSGDTRYNFAYNTVFQGAGSKQYGSNGVTELFAKDSDSKYKRFIPAASFATPYLFTGAAPGSGGSERNKWLAFKFNPAAIGANVLAFGGFAYIQDFNVFSGSVSYTGNYTFQIATVKNNRPDVILAESVRSYADVGAGNSGAVRKVEFLFSKITPIVDEELFLIIGNDYKITVTGSAAGWQEKGLVFGLGGGGNYNYLCRRDSRIEYVEQGFSKGTPNATDQEWKGQNITGTVFAGLQACTTTDFPAGIPQNLDIRERKNVSYLQINVPKSFAGQTITTEPQTNDFQFKVNGIKDDNAGTITTVPNFPILSEPKFIFKLLLATRNQFNEYIPSQINITRFASSNAITSTTNHPLFRAVAGVAQGFTTISSVLKQITKESATFLYLDADTAQPVVYTYGAKLPTAARVSDFAARLLTHQIQPLESVVNNVSLSYGRNLINIDVENLFFNLGEYEQFENLLIGDFTNNATAAKSYQLYGDRKNRAETLDWINDPQSAKVYLDYLISTLDRPSIYVQFSMPEIEPSLKNLQSCELVFPQLPAAQGTSANAFNVERGTAQVWQDTNAVRAQTYRAQIIGIRQLYNPENQIEVEYTAKLLIHESDPT